MDGGTLRSRIVHDGRLSEDRATQVMGDLLEALAIYHERGVVHAGVTPENVHFDALRRAQLAVPGAAESGDAAVLQRARKYQAPEQLRGETAGPAADLFAAGVILHEMLTGSPPFEASTAADLLTNQAGGVPELAGAATLARLHRALLAYAPAERPASARHALDLLRAPRALDVPPGPANGPLSQPPAHAARRTASGRVPFAVPLIAVSVLAALGIAAVALKARPAPPAPYAHDPAAR